MTNVEIDTEQLSKQTHELLHAVATFISQYMVLTSDQLVVVSLWVLHTYVLNAAETTPYLHVTSVLRECGKSRLLDVLELLAFNAVKFSQPSEAVVYRLTNLRHATMLWDEIDAIFNAQSAKDGSAAGMRGVLDEGYRRGGMVMRCINFGQELEDIDVFCPKVLAGIGRIPDTISSRSIPIRLQRRLTEETVARFRARTVRPLAKNLKDQLATWGPLAVPILADTWPELPDEMTDRQQDIVEPLLAIADLAGEEWATQSRKSLIGLLVTGDDSGEDNTRLRILSDCRSIYESGDDYTAERISATDLVTRLRLIVDSPWGKDDYDLTASRLRKYLRDFEIHPGQYRAEMNRRVTGYKWVDFKDAWRRYL